MGSCSTSLESYAFFFSSNCTKLPWILFFLRICPVYNNDNEKEGVSHVSRENKNKQDRVKSLTPDQEAANFFSKGLDKYFRLCRVRDLCDTSETQPWWDESSNRQEETNESTWKTLVTKTLFKSFIYKSRCEFEPLLGDPYSPEELGCPRRPLSFLSLCYVAMQNTGDHLFRWVRISDVIHLMRRANSSEKSLMLGKTEGRSRKGHQRMRWLDGITGYELRQTSGDGGGQGGLACCSPWGHRVGHNWATELNWTDSSNS